MSHTPETLPPFPPEVLRLLEQESSASAHDAVSWQPSAGMMERVASKLPWANAAAAAAMASVRVATGVALAACVAGVGLGAGVTLLWTAGIPAPVQVPAPQPPQAVGPAPAVQQGPVTPPEVSGPAQPAVKEHRTAAPRPAAVSTPPKGDSAAERALLERARSALARQEPGLALEALEEHKKRFGASQLAQERDALEAFSWAALGNSGAVHHAVVVFRKKYPQSPLLQALDALEKKVP